MDHTSLTDHTNLNNFNHAHQGHDGAGTFGGYGPGADPQGGMNEVDISILLHTIERKLKL